MAVPFRKKPVAALSAEVRPAFPRPFPLTFHPGTIADIIWKPLRKFQDTRGWLCELFRHDELPQEWHPEMAYLSVTQPGVARGPHEHVSQADLFCFLGPANFKLYLWDNRPQSPTYRVFQMDLVGAERPMAVVVPPGVVHAYKNVGTEAGPVINCPNRLYKGRGRKEAVDEIRHEEDKDSPFQLD
jgi:dTDP-4-dehydrorhamnose 3,5-epimerase